MQRAAKHNHWCKRVRMWGFNLFLNEGQGFRDTKIMPLKPVSKYICFWMLSLNKLQLYITPAFLFQTTILKTFELEKFKQNSFGFLHYRPISCKVCYNYCIVLKSKLYQKLCHITWNTHFWKTDGIPLNGNHSMPLKTFIMF